MPVMAIQGTDGIVQSLAGLDVGRMWQRVVNPRRPTFFLKGI
jgi:hypothetical protein